jgi:hypothetical protein
MVTAISRSRVTTLLPALLLACGSPPPPANTADGRPPGPAAAPAAGERPPATAAPPAATNSLDVGLDPTPAPMPIHPVDDKMPEVTAMPAMSAPPAAMASLRVEADKTRFKITLPDGHVLTDSEMIGVVLTIRDDSNAWRKIRVDAIKPDPNDPEITLYDLSVQDPATKEWAQLCAPAPDKTTLAFPLAGVWSPDGRHLPSEPVHFNVTCTQGAAGKCVRFGYKPWVTRPDGAALWDYHQACVRMLRGDYCGDGEPWTRDGTLINLYDPLEIQRSDPGPDLSFEAGWGADGALCVNHPRIPENVTLATLEQRCPDHLRGRTGAACTEESLRGNPALRTLNHSKDRTAEVSPPK